MVTTVPSSSCELTDLLHGSQIVYKLFSQIIITGIHMYITIFYQTCCLKINIICQIIFGRARNLIYLFFKHIAVALENSIFFLASIPIMYKKYPLYFMSAFFFILAFITLGFLYPFCSRKSIKSFSVFI